MKIPNRKNVLQIPYETAEGEKVYKCENDILLSKNQFGNDHQIQDGEIIVSTKTTSKDRMGKIFIDKILMERFTGKSLKVIGIFLNDVQRKGPGSINFTLVTGLFLVYSEFLTELDGVYYLDLPPTAQRSPLSNYIKRFSDLLTQDLDLLLAP